MVLACVVHGEVRMEGTQWVHEVPPGERRENEVKGHSTPTSQCKTSSACVSEFH